MAINPYLALAVNGFFTGLGVVTAQHFYELYLRKKVNVINKQQTRIKKLIDKKIGFKKKK